MAIENNEVKLKFRNLIISQYINEMNFGEGMKLSLIFSYYIKFY